MATALEPATAGRRAGRIVVVLAVLLALTTAAFATVLVRQRSEQRAFRRTSGAVLDALVRTDRSLLGADRLGALAADPAAPRESMLEAVRASAAALDRLRLPARSGRFKDDVAVVRAAVLEHRTFVRRLETLLLVPMVEVDDGRLTGLLVTWKDAMKDAKRLARVVKRSLPSAIEDPPALQRFRDTFGAAADAARDARRDADEAIRDRDQALATLQRYHDDVEALLTSYEKARDALSNQRNRDRTITSYSEEADFRRAYEDAADARRGLADSLDAVVPPPSLASQHAAVASVIRRQASLVAGAAAAASEAYCYESIFGPPTRCRTIGDTRTYSEYLEQSGALYEEYKRHRDALRAGYEAEVRRFYAG